MMVESGQVIAKEQGSIWVETEQKTSCGSCAARNGCGQSLLSRMHPERKNVLQLTIDEPADKLTDGADEYDFVPAIGDIVEFSVPDNAVLKGASLVYLLPLMGMLIGALVSVQLSSLELVVIVASVVGFYLGYRTAALIGGGAYYKQLQPQLVRRHSSPQQISIQ